MNNVVSLGPCASGKGGITSMLEEVLKIPSVVMGDLLRNEIKNGTSLGKQVKQKVEAGILVDDIIVTDLLAEYLQGIDIKKGIVLDGYPRTLDQAKSLDTIMPIDIAYSILAPLDLIKEVTTNRLFCCDCGELYISNLHNKQLGDKCEKCNGVLFRRHDDTKEVIEQRLSAYSENIPSIREHYANKGILHEIHLENKLSVNNAVIRKRYVLLNTFAEQLKRQANK